MKKKVLTLCLAAIIAVMAISGASLAYLKDYDSVKNVMTAGNVKIVQNEKDRFGADFADDQRLLPAVYTNLTKDLKYTDADGTEIMIWGESINNEIDKFVSVTNRGSEAAYIRTVFAFETRRHYAEGSSTEFTDLHDVYLGVNGTMEYLNLYITVDGVEYCLAVCTYADPVAAGATTSSSLRQIFLSPDAGNEFYDIFGPTYEILCLSQAVQVQGFDDARTALDTAFGQINAANATEWFEAVK